MPASRLHRRSAADQTHAQFRNNRADRRERALGSWRGRHGLSDDEDRVQLSRDWPSERELRVGDAGMTRSRDTGSRGCSSFRLSTVTGGVKRAVQNIGSEPVPPASRLQRPSSPCAVSKHQREPVPHLSPAAPVRARGKPADRQARATADHGRGAWNAAARRTRGRRLSAAAQREKRAFASRCSSTIRRSLRCDRHQTE